MVFSINRHAISIISTATHPDPTMELFYISLFLISFLLLKFFSPSQAKKRAAMLPPGPPKLPVIGSLHHLRGSLPHRIFRDLAQTYGPLMHLQLGEISTVVVSSKDVAREMLTTHDRKFSSRPDILASRIIVYDGTDMLFAPYGEYWRQLRKIGVMEVLSPKRVQSFRRVREEEALDLVLRVRTAAGSSSPVNLSELILSLMNNVVARAAIGSKCNDASTYLKALKEGVELASGFSLPDLFPSFSIVGSVTGIKSKLENCHKRIDAILDGIVEEQMKRRASAMTKRGNGDNESSVVMEDNILDVLLNLQAKNADGFTLTRTNIKALIFDILTGGTGTAASGLTWAMSELMKNPAVMKKAQDEVRQALRGKTSITEANIGELSYLKLVTKEALRLHPPAPLLVPRESSEDCVISGYLIPARTRVLFNAWAIGRDPGNWDDAEAFSPERLEGRPADFKGNSQFDYMPFGGGRRMCPGVHFGLASMELPLAQLLYHFDWSLPEGVEELDMEESFGLGARRKNDLCLLATPYIPA